MARVVVAGATAAEYARLPELLDTDGLQWKTLQSPKALGGVAAGDVVLICDGFAAESRTALVLGILRRRARALVISATPLDEAGSEFLLAGASGYLMLDELGAGELRQAVDAVVAGRSALHPAVALAVLEQWRSHRAVPSAQQPVLTVRERDVLVGVSDGLTTRLLARRLGVAEKTVEAHRSRLYAKLGARNRTDALHVAAQRGLLDEPRPA